MEEGRKTTLLAASDPTSPTELDRSRGGALTLEQLSSQIPEEAEWLAALGSDETLRAYKQDVLQFMKFVGVADVRELRNADHKAITAWKRSMLADGANPVATKRAGKPMPYSKSTVRRRLAALSSLFTHLKEHNLVDINPAVGLRRPKVNRRTGKTPAFSQKQARRILDAPNADTLLGLRDRAILQVGFSVGPRRAEIAGLRVRDIQQDRGLWCLNFRRKGGEEELVTMNDVAHSRIRAYLEAAGHGGEPDAPLFKPIRTNLRGRSTDNHLDPWTVDHILRKYQRKAGIKGNFSAHSMRATFVTTALENGCPLEDVQHDAGHADPSTTKLYDRRGRDPEKAASFFANY